jgi:hypothetical protein
MDFNLWLLVQIENSLNWKKKNNIFAGNWNFHALYLGIFFFNLGIPCT